MSKSRLISVYEKSNIDIPESLFHSESDEIGSFHFDEPLPFKKSEIRFFKKQGNVTYVASEKFIARIDLTAQKEYDKVYVFSAKKDFPQGKILHILPSENDLWVETEGGVSHIELKEISLEEKAEILRKETLETIDRLGYVSAKRLTRPYDKSSKLPYNHDDNDGGFTASYSIGEICRYHVLKKRYGKNNETVRDAFRTAVRKVECCLLLFYVSGRDDGFVARTFVTTSDPESDDGLFMRKKGNKAYVLDTTDSREKNRIGMISDASNKIPERLRNIYLDEGFTDDDIIFKGDTSSDETTLHYANLYFAHLILGEDDKELDDLIVHCVRKITDHIIKNNFQLCDFDGNPTTWAKWSEEYFTPQKIADGDDVRAFGWCDAPENAAEILSYLLIAESITGDKKYRDTYFLLIEKGYDNLVELHHDRTFMSAVMNRLDEVEDIMYGDHMLANLSFFFLNYLEDDENLRKKYFNGWLSWRKTSLAREHCPIYDCLFKVCFPNEKIDMELFDEWFERFSTSMLESEPDIYNRRDVPTREYRQGYLESSVLLPPDERQTRNYNSNPFQIRKRPSAGEYSVRCSSMYTTAYWLEKFFNE